MSLSIEVRWDEEVTKKLKKLGEKDLIAAREKRLKEASIILEWESKKEAPVKNWMLRKSITSKAFSMLLLFMNEQLLILSCLSLKKLFIG